MPQPVLLRHVREPDQADIHAYERRGGYAGLRRALRELSPEQVTDLVDRAQLRGRGGAGFPTGRKWKFVPKDA
ncbi:MAG: NADH-quinone oxidoreductase subunit F, partial [Firmicutes bacterium]|nr:NADH-quinone oxidoreductase subunit F [Bacillota bacterium]